MKRTTIFLPDHVHRSLKYIALDHNASMAELLREAIEKVYKEDIKDIHLAAEARKEHKKNPKSAMEASVYFNKRTKRN